MKGCDVPGFVLGLGSVVERWTAPGGWAGLSWAGLLWGWGGAVVGGALMGGAMVGGAVMGGAVVGGRHRTDGLAL